MHQFKFTGPANVIMTDEVGSTVTSGVTWPIVRQQRGISNEQTLTDLKSSMLSRGWEFEEDAVPDGPSLKQIQRSKLSADAAAITSTTFVTVLSVSVVTRGGTVLQIRGSVIAGVLIGGNARVVINGGAFSNEVLATTGYPVLGNSNGGGDAYVDVPSTENETTYTVRVECAAIALGSVTPRAGSSLIVEEYA